MAAKINLKNTKWYFSNNIYFNYYHNGSYNITFEANNEIYIKFIVKNSTISYYKDSSTQLIVYENGTWHDQVYRTIKIIGGDDVHNQTLWSFIMQNATNIKLGKEVVLQDDNIAVYPQTKLNLLINNKLQPVKMNLLEHVGAINTKYSTGTPIPVDDETVIEKIFLNTNLTTDEVVKIIDDLCTNFGLSEGTDEYGNSNSLCPLAWTYVKDMSPGRDRSVLVAEKVIWAEEGRTVYGISRDFGGDEAMEYVFYKSIGSAESPIPIDGWNANYYKNKYFNDSVITFNNKNNMAFYDEMAAFMKQPDYQKMVAKLISRYPFATHEYSTTKLSTFDNKGNLIENNPILANTLGINLDNSNIFYKTTPLPYLNNWNKRSAPKIEVTDIYFNVEDTDGKGQFQYLNTFKDHFYTGTLDLFRINGIGSFKIDYSYNSWKLILENDAGDQQIYWAGTDATAGNGWQPNIVDHFHFKSADFSISDYSPHESAVSALTARLVSVAPIIKEKVSDKNTGTLFTYKDNKTVYPKTIKSQLFEDDGQTPAVLGGSPYYNPNKVNLFGFTPDSANNTCTFKADAENPLDIDWGDGTKETITSEVTHTYQEPYKEIMVIVKGKMKYSSFINYTQKINKNLDYVNLVENDITENLRMFEECRKLVKIDSLYICGCGLQTFGGLFKNCSDLPSLLNINMNRRTITSTSSMFSGCSNLLNICSFYTKEVTNMSSMFECCSSLTTIPLLNTINVTDMRQMFLGCNNLTTIPKLNTSKVTMVNSMFENCSSLYEVPDLDLSKAEGLATMFFNCQNLEHIHIKNINADLNIHWSTKMEQPALREVIDNLVQQQVGTTKTLTVGETLKAKLKVEDVQLATSKGWTIA